MRRLKLYYLFFHSTLKINVPLSILGALIVSKADWSLFWEAFPYLLGGWGIVASLLYKEFLEKEAYFFYYNSGIIIEKVGFLFKKLLIKQTGNNSPATQ